MRNYLEFFGFRDDPFKITPDANYFFLSESHQEALTALRYILESEEGFAVVIGEPGTGKTLTVRKFIEELPSSVKYAYILFPNLSPEELFEAVLEDLGIPATGGTKNRLFSTLRDYLIETRREGGKVLIVVDEAQNLPPETLEELRILSNLETDSMKLLQIILLGQPELEEKLDSPGLRQLRQRITVLVRLRNFTFEETKAYVDFRIAKAGSGNLRIHPGVYKRLYRYSLGIPRVINILMERSLMAAFVDESREIKPSHVDRSAESIGIRVRGKEVKSLRIALSVGAVVLAGSLLLLYRYGDRIGAELAFQRKETLRSPSGQVRRAVVNVPMLNMRESPDLKSGVIYVLREGDELEVVGEGPQTWLLVRFKRDNLELEGWVNGKYLSSR